MPHNYVHRHAPVEEDSDLCVCGEMICPDTRVPVFYNDCDPTLPAYFHRDGSTCFLHQVGISLDWELLMGWDEHEEYMREEDPEWEPQPYAEYLREQIDNHEQIWREEPRERDLTEAYLQTLRSELAKLGNITA